MLLGNGMPHFLFGVAGKVFRSPFGQRSKPPVNVAWGTFNFVAATALAFWRWARQPPRASDLPLLVLGFWLTVLMFGLTLKTRFLSE